MEADVIISVYFYRPDEGGRTIEIRGAYYSCPLFVHGEGFDCRIFLGETVIRPGATYQLPAKFLSPEIALTKIAINEEIVLWEGREIASGTIIEILSK